MTLKLKTTAATVAAAAAAAAFIDGMEMRSDDYGPGGPGGPGGPPGPAGPPKQSCSNQQQHTKLRLHP